MRPRVVIAAAILASATFAVWPRTPRKIVVPTLERHASREAKPASALDLAAFRIPIWVAEAPPPAPPPTPVVPPLPPLKLQLLAIIGEKQTDGMTRYSAAVYDPDSDRVLVVAAGEKVGPRTVEHVNQDTLTLRDDAGQRVLALKEGGIS